MNGDQEPEVLAGTEINRSEIHAVGDIDELKSRAGEDSLESYFLKLTGGIEG